MSLEIYDTPSKIKSLGHKVAKSPDKYSFFRLNDQLDYTFFTIEQKGMIHGMLACQFKHDSLTLEYCEVGESFRRRGIAKTLVDEFVTHAARYNLYVEVSPYEDDGIKGLQPVVRDACTKMGVSLIESGYAQDIANDPQAW